MNMKIKNIKILTYTVVVLLIVNLTALGVIVYNRWLSPKPSCPGAGFERLKQKLSLTPEQEEKLWQERGDFHKRLDALSLQLQKDQRALIAALKRENSDWKELKDIIMTINARQLEAQEQVVEHLLEVKNMLKPEQQDIFFSIVQERFEMDDKPGEGRYLRLR